jgi:octaprenyl-diphosphate synthase
MISTFRESVIECATARLLTGFLRNLCSLGFGRVKLIGPADRSEPRNRQENWVAVRPSVDRVRAGRKPSLEPLSQLLGSELDRVNQLIVERMQSPVALIPKLAGHIIASGGKRLRPMLTLGCARLCGYSGGRHIGLAAAVEFIHTATLLHDDVVDASNLRRGRDTANAVWGNKPPILVGDFLFSRSFELMVADGSLRILEILSRASSVIAEGEVLQLMTQNDLQTTEASYLEVIQAKTAELFAAASRIGAVLAQRPHDEEEALDRFGRNLGIAFQLVDDMLDFSARQAELGKSIGDDFRDGKVTLPIVIAFARGDREERAFWHRALEDMDQRAGDLEHAIALVECRGALAETLSRARAYAAAAIDSLSIFRNGTERRALTDAAGFATERSS